MMYEHDVGTSGTVTVPSGRVVRSYSCLAGGAGATITITPNGGSAQGDITVPANGSWSYSFDLAANDTGTAALGDGSTIAFTGTTSYVVVYA